MSSSVLRKTGLTMHVLASVGWVGAVLAFAALGWIGLRSTDLELVRAAYLSARVITWTVIVPLSAASLLTGVVQSLGTNWGLFRHYWVVAKLVLATVATVLLLVHTGPVDAVAQWAHAHVAPDPLLDLRQQLVVDGALGAALLVLVTALSVFKPRGLTTYGWRRSQLAGRSERVTSETTPGPVDRVRGAPR